MPRDASLSQAIQDYLKAIFEISPEGGPTTTNQIAERLGVKPASVTGMIKRLAALDPPLLSYQKHHGVQLTDAGRQVSLQVIRKHRLIERFLVQTLGYSWDEVHEEAERLEHAVSFQFAERLARLLGEPDFDPHGDPIPDRDLKLPKMRTISLMDAPKGSNVSIRRVLSSDPELLRYLTRMGVQPGAEITVVEQVPFDRTVHIRAGNEERVLGADISTLLQVEVLK